MAYMTPKQILLFRHAEKPSLKNDPGLSASGVQRAQQLVTYIPSQFGKPDFIFATAQGKSSNRPYLTVEPLANALNMKIHNKIADNDFNKLATELLTQPTYFGKLVVVCWHHGNIPNLANSLSAPIGSYPDPWKGSVFNLILNIVYDESGNASLTQVVEPF